jgi:hypothetical protein
MVGSPSISSHLFLCSSSKSFLSALLAFQCSGACLLNILQLVCLAFDLVPKMLRHEVMIYLGISLAKTWQLNSAVDLAVTLAGALVTFLVSNHLTGMTHSDDTA